MMIEGITMKQVHTPQSTPPPLPLMLGGAVQARRARTL